jgi:predicted nucleotidyltransferase
MPAKHYFHTRKDGKSVYTTKPVGKSVDTAFSQEKAKKRDKTKHYYFLSKEGRLFDIWDKNDLGMTELEFNCFCKACKLDVQLLSYSEALKLEKQFDRELRKQLKKEDKKFQFESRERLTKYNSSDTISYKNKYGNIDPYMATPVTCYSYGKDGVGHLSSNHEF